MIKRVLVANHQCKKKWYDRLLISILTLSLMKKLSFLIPGTLIFSISQMLAMRVENPKPHKLRGFPSHDLVSIWLMSTDFASSSSDVMLFSSDSTLSVFLFVSQISTSLWLSLMICNAVRSMTECAGEWVSQENFKIWNLSNLVNAPVFKLLLASFDRLDVLMVKQCQFLSVTWRATCFWVCSDESSVSLRNFADVSWIWRIVSQSMLFLLKTQPDSTFWTKSFESDVPLPFSCAMADVLGSLEILMKSLMLHPQNSSNSEIRNKFDCQTLPKQWWLNCSYYLLSSFFWLAWIFLSLPHLCSDEALNFRCCSFQTLRYEKDAFIGFLMHKILV